jgi:cytochrome c553
VPANLAEAALIRKGAWHYDVACRSCHGEPGGELPRLAIHLLPQPPALSARIRESDPKKLFYVVKHGIKFTAMPAWPSARRDDEVWAVVAFLLQYPQLDAAAYRRLAGRQTPPAAGAPLTLAASCAQCHGDDGLSHDNALLPRLAGQREAYLLKTLEAFARGARHSGTMEPIAAALTPEARTELARDYAAMKPGAVLPARASRGEAIAREGIAAQRVPACVECHGPGAKRGKPEYPTLAGQPADYLELQLTLFREQRRGGSDHAHLMQPIASRLTPAQARDVAEYFASLTPAAPP